MHLVGTHGRECPHTHANQHRRWRVMVPHELRNTLVHDVGSFCALAVPRLALDLAIDDAAYSINVRERLMEVAALAKHV